MTAILCTNLVMLALCLGPIAALAQLPNDDIYTCELPLKDVRVGDVLWYLAVRYQNVNGIAHDLVRRVYTKSWSGIGLR